MFLKSKGFLFDGKHTDDFQLRLCQVGETNGTQSFGVERTLETESIGTMMLGLKSINYSTLKFDITLAKTDGIDLLPFSEQDKFEIIQWLFNKDDFKAITFDDQKDILYYVMFTKGSSYQNGFKQGYINLTMELNAPCGFTNITTDVMRVQEETTFEIFNRTNVEAFSYPDVEFELIGETDWIEIENLTTGDVMRFEGLKPSTHAYCYNEGLKQLICVNDPAYNIRPTFNRVWLKLAYGRNCLKVRTVDAKINIIGQSKIALQ